MNINTINKKEYEQDKIQNNVNEIFGQKHYVQRSNSIFSEMKTKLQDLIENIISKNEKNIDSELNAKFLDLDFGAEFNIDADKIGVNDAIFFVNLLNSQNLITYTINDNEISLLDSNGKKINATNPLLNMISTSLETKKPIRLDFDNDVTVILKLDKEGKIQAHFIPGTSEVESYLKQNIHCLKQRFDDQNINYSQLSYSKQKENNKNRKRKK